MTQPDTADASQDRQEPKKQPFHVRRNGRTVEEGSFLFDPRDPPSLGSVQDRLKSYAPVGRGEVVLCVQFDADADRGVRR